MPCSRTTDFRRIWSSLVLMIKSIINQWKSPSKEKRKTIAPSIYLKAKLKTTMLLSLGKQIWIFFTFCFWCFFFSLSIILAEMFIWQARVKLFYQKYPPRENDQKTIFIDIISSQAWYHDWYPMYIKSIQLENMCSNTPVF